MPSHKLQNSAQCGKEARFNNTAATLIFSSPVVAINTLRHPPASAARTLRSSHQQGKAD